MDLSEALWLPPYLWITLSQECQLFCCHLHHLPGMWTWDNLSPSLQWAPKVEVFSTVANKRIVEHRMYCRDIVTIISTVTIITIFTFQKLCVPWKFLCRCNNLQVMRSWAIVEIKEDNVFLLPHCLYPALQTKSLHQQVVVELRMRITDSPAYHYNDHQISTTLFSVDLKLYLYRKILAAGIS